MGCGERERRGRELRRLDALVGELAVATASSLMQRGEVGGRTSASVASVPSMVRLPVTSGVRPNAVLAPTLGQLLLHPVADERARVGLGRGLNSPTELSTVHVPSSDERRLVGVAARSRALLGRFRRGVDVDRGGAVSRKTKYQIATAATIDHDERADAEPEELAAPRLGGRGRQEGCWGASARSVTGRVLSSPWDARRWTVGVQQCRGSGCARPERALRRSTVGACPADCPRRGTVGNTWRPGGIGPVMEVTSHGAPRGRCPCRCSTSAPVGRGSSPADALAHSTELVREVRAARLPAPLGGGAPQHARHRQLVAAGAAGAPGRRHVEPIRLGSGGLMLPNHAPLAVAEQFGMLEALHPGRIDLGIGRAPGTDPLTASALRRGDGVSAPTTSPTSSASCSASSTARSPRSTRTGTSPRCPRSATAPTSGCSAPAPTARRRPRYLGMPFSFAYHFAPALLTDALDAYRSRVPSVGAARPALRDARRVGAVRADRRRRTLAGRLRRARVPAAAPGPSRRVPDARGGGGVPIHPPRARDGAVVDLVARDRHPAPCAPASTSWWPTPRWTSSWSRRWRTTTTTASRPTASSPTRGASPRAAPRHSPVSASQTRDIYTFLTPELELVSRWSRSRPARPCSRRGRARMPPSGASRSPGGAPPPTSRRRRGRGRRAPVRRT